MNISTGVVKQLSKDYKTAVVVSTFYQRHPKLSKIVRKTKKTVCHYDGQDNILNSNVSFSTCRPLSKTKRHKIINVK